MNGKEIVIGIFKGQSQYDVLRYFADDIAEAFARLGCKVYTVDLMQDGYLKEVYYLYFSIKPDITIAFNSITPGYFENKDFFDYFNVPHIALLVDHPIYQIYRFKNITSPNLYIGCVDRTHASFLQEKFNNVKAFFFPHSTALKNNAQVVNGDRDIDILFAGSLKDPAEIENNWEKTFSPKVFDMMMSISELGLKLNKYTLHKLFEDNIPPTLLEDKNELLKIESAFLPHIDGYIRAKKRIQLISALKDFKLKIFGNGSWETALEDKGNIEVNPMVDYRTLSQLLQRSQIVLNNIPCHPDGSHERVFDGMMSAALVLSDRGKFLEEYFVEDEDMLFYDLSCGEEAIKDKVDFYLKHKEARGEIAENGMCKTGKYHTWLSRAQIIMDMLS